MDSDLESIVSSEFNSLHGSSGEPEEPVFELLKEIGEDIWIAVRQGDPRGEQFLASPDPYARELVGQKASKSRQHHEEASALHQLLYQYNQAYTIRQILNHENLISLVGSLEYRAFNKTQDRDSDESNSVRFLVWDFCDAANLSALFREHYREDPSHYLPESLCWHVLRSLTRAVTYLHDGKRLYFDAQLPPGFAKEWVCVDQDWLPILHRGIEPKHIYFQHPRGTELYGQCKLGDFRNVAVTCHAVNAMGDSLSAEDRVSTGMALATRKGNKPLVNSRHNFEKDPETIPEGDRPYTLSDEMWSIGAVIFTMMTGDAPTYCCNECRCSHVYVCESGGCLEVDATAKGCDCLLGGCSHVSQGSCGDDMTLWTPCPPEHNCPEPNINIHSHLARARYTKMLRKIIGDLLYHDPHRHQNPWVRMVDFAQVVEEAYQEWKTETEEGKDYVDIDDDMAVRWRMARDWDVPSYAGDDDE
ncbi:hypothetical protein FZEAL_5978 [Fusarium zealandicum]|uniref:Protein kinase domain-containing protein n=1 Tax=Fusarium zealandicum TaxID=1053134 RepID=A0A8H4XJY4_9HYPO|nr:hypothetical protein FZEAL_5978 [Fusarium zealandicum]